MLELGNSSDLYTYVGGGHCPFSNMDIVLEFTSNFMYDVVCEDDNQGDVNSDGVINVLDVVAAVNFVLGSATPSDSQACASDFNGDGVINILDAVQLVNIILGGDDGIPT